MLVAIWYPARTTPDDPRMTLEAFRLLELRELDFEEATEAERRSARERHLELAVRLGLSPEAAP